MSVLLIKLDCSDDSDLDWLRDRAVAKMEELRDEQINEGRIDGTVEVTWDIED